MPRAGGSPVFLLSQYRRSACGSRTRRGRRWAALPTAASPGTDAPATTADTAGALDAPLHRPIAGAHGRGTARRRCVSGIGEDVLPRTCRISPGARTPTTAAASSVCGAGASGNRAEGSLVVGYHEDQRTHPWDVVSPICDHRSVQPVCRRLVGVRS